MAQYGNVDQNFDLKDIIDYYMNIGKTTSAKKLIEKVQNQKEKDQLKETLRQKIHEKQIEKFYLDNLQLVENGLTLWDDGELTGHQYETPDGGRLDILALSKDKEFVVLEFKRDKTSDATVGQILRYMGWVCRNLADNNTVRGYIISDDFDKYLDYALVGMQHPNIPKNPNERYALVTKFKHIIDVTKGGEVDLSV